MKGNNFLIWKKHTTIYLVSLLPKELPFKDKRCGDPVKDSAYDPQIEYGVIAQDIYKISGLEDIVRVGDDKTKWSVDYRSIDTITLGAVKGLIDKIEKLEARIKVLEGN